MARGTASASSRDKLKYAVFSLSYAIKSCGLEERTRRLFHSLLPLEEREECDDGERHNERQQPSERHESRVHKGRDAGPQRRELPYFRLSRGQIGR